MRPLLVPGFALLALGSLGASSPSSAAACEGDSVRWNPQRSWPIACEADVPLDGLVLLEGDALAADLPGGEGPLEVVLSQMEGGEARARYLGEVTSIAPDAALFRSERELLPHTDYQLTARRLGSSEAAYTSKFTTGERRLAPLTLQAAPTLQVEQYDEAPKQCTRDGCGVERCQESGEPVATRAVRIAVPAISGGIEQRPYVVSAELTRAQGASVVASSDSVATQANRRSFLLVAVPRELPAGEACVTLRARDVAGHELRSAPVCTTLPALEQPPVSGAASEGPSASEPLALRESVEPVSAEHNAEGCAIGRSEQRLQGLGWLALGLTLARLRSRKRATVH